MALKVGELYGVLKLEDKEFNSGVDRAEGKFHGLSTGISKGGLIIGAAVAGVAVAASSMAISFERDMANVGTLLGREGVDRVKELGDEVKQMSADTGKSLGDLSGGLYQVVSAFGDTADSSKILETASKASVAGIATTTDAVNLLSAVTKGYGDTSAAAVEKASDLAFQTVKLGQTTFPELAASMGKVVPLAATLAIKQEELFGATAALTGVTGNTAEVMTQLRGTTQALINTNPAMLAQLQALGYENGQAAIQALGFQGTLDALSASVDGDTKKLAEMFGSVEALNAVLALTGAQSVAFTEKTAAMGEAAGATTEAFEIQQATVGAKFDRILAKGQVALVNFGEAFLPIIASGADLVESLSGVLAIAAPLAEVFADHAYVIVPALALVVGVKLVAGLSAAEIKAKGLAIGMRALKGAALFGIPLAIGLAVDAGNAFHDWVDSIRFTADELEQLGRLAEVTGSDKWAEAFLKLGVSGDEAAKLIDAAEGDIGKAFQALKEHSGDWELALRALRGTTDEEVTAMGVTFGTLPRNVAGALADGAGEVADAAEEMVRPTWEEVAEARKLARQEAWGIPGAIADAIIGGKAELEDVGNTIKDILAGSVSDAKTLMQNSAALMNPGIAQALTGNSSQAKDAMLTDVVNPLLESILALEAGAFEVGANIPPELKAALEQNGPLALEALRDLVGDSSATLAELADYAREHGLDGLAAYIDGIRSQHGEVATAAQDQAKAARDNLKFDAFEGGASSAATFIAGMNAVIANDANWRNVRDSLHEKKLAYFGGSLPRRGPFAAGPLKEGAVSISSYFLGELAGGLRTGIHDLEDALGPGLAMNLGPMVASDPVVAAAQASGFSDRGPMLAAMQDPGAVSQMQDPAFVASLLAAGGEVHFHRHIDTTVEGGLRDVDSKEDLGDVIRRSDALLAGWGP